MKTIIAAGLAGLFLSGAALAQDEWTYISCNVGISEWQGGRMGEPQPETQIYRFNATDLDQFQPGNVTSWKRWCRPQDNPTRTECIIDDDRVAHFRTYEEGQSRLQIDVVINRSTGAFFYQYDSVEPGRALVHRRGNGTCGPTTNPLPDARRF